MNGERLAIGYVAGAHGIRGGLRVILHDAESDALAIGRQIILVRTRPGGDAEEIGAWALASVAAIPGQAGRFRVTLEGVASRDDADVLKGCTVEMSREHLPPLGDDEYYLADAVGLKVIRARDDGTVQELGQVVGLMNNGAQDLFEVEYLGGRGRPLQWLLPVLPGFVLDVDEERVLADVPLGMLPPELEG